MNVYDLFSYSDVLSTWDNCDLSYTMYVQFDSAEEYPSWFLCFDYSNTDIEINTKRRTQSNMFKKSVYSSCFYF